MQRAISAARGWIEASHPFPLAAVVLLTGLVAIASAGPEGVDGGRLALVLLAMLLSQLAIGWTNDYVDRDLDRVYQPSKPVATGRVDARLMPLAIAAVLAGALLAGALLGALSLALLAVGTTAGLGYDLFLKETRWSWLPYLVAFAVLPPYVWSSLDLYRGDLASMYLVATPLVPAVHIANVLPDLEGDAASGRRSIVVLWGRRRSISALAALLAAPAALALISMLWVRYDTAVLLLMLAGYAALLAGAFVCYAGAREAIAFRLVAVTGVLFVTGWLVVV